MEESDSPLFDFDGSVLAMIEPEKLQKMQQFRSIPTACVITFFADSLRRLQASGRVTLISENAWEDGPHRLWDLTVGDAHVTVLHSGVGAPLSAGLLEEAILAESLRRKGSTHRGVRASGATSRRVNRRHRLNG